jgi:hypothetical protein
VTFSNFAAAFKVTATQADPPPLFPSPPLSRSSASACRVLAGRRGVGSQTTVLVPDQCGAEMFWTQNAWRSGDEARGVYRCSKGHLIDPTLTRQCPNCGLHDTTRIDALDGKERYQCFRCGNAFDVPR